MAGVPRRAVLPMYAARVAGCVERVEDLRAAVPDHEHVGPSPCERVPRVPYSQSARPHRQLHGADILGASGVSECRAQSCGEKRMQRSARVQPTLLPIGMSHASAFDELREMRFDSRGLLQAHEVRQSGHEAFLLVAIEQAPANRDRREDDENSARAARAQTRVRRSEWWAV